MLNYAEHVGMPESLMSTVCSDADGLEKRCTATLSPAQTMTIQSYFSGTKGVEKKRYSSTAVRFQLLYYHNRLIVKQFSLRACAECARPCARLRDSTIVYSSTRGSSNTLWSSRSSVTPLQVCPEFPSKHLVFEVNSQKLHKINKL